MLPPPPSSARQQHHHMRAAANSNPLPPYSRLHPSLPPPHGPPTQSTTLKTYHETREDRPLALHARALSNSGACRKERRRSRGCLLFLFVFVREGLAREMTWCRPKTSSRTLPKHWQEGYTEQGRGRRTLSTSFLSEGKAKQVACCGPKMRGGLKREGLIMPVSLSLSLPNTPHHTSHPPAPHPPHRPTHTPYSVLAWWCMGCGCGAVAFVC